MRGTEWTASSINIRTEKSGVVLVITSEVGAEVVVEEIAIKAQDPLALLTSISSNAEQIRELLAKQAA
ncbi:MAG: hypothetical protein U1D30_21400 [Planctomycetota bacterium]